MVLRVFTASGQGHMKGNRISCHLLRRSNWKATLKLLKTHLKQLGERCLTLTDRAFRCFIKDHCTEFICSSCDECHYRNSVWLVSAVVRLKVEGDADLQGSPPGQKSVENKEWVSNDSARFLLKKKMPPENRLNSILFSSIDEAIRNSPFAEEKLVALNVILMSMTKRPRGGQYASKGGIANVPLKTPLAIHTRPRFLLEKEVLTINTNRRVSDKQAHFVGLCGLQIYWGWLLCWPRSDLQRT